jgi:hypothetical protein
MTPLGPSAEDGIHVPSIVARTSAFVWSES